MGGVIIYDKMQIMKYTESTISRAKELRKNMPDAERKLWFAINYDKLGVKFRRQQPIISGRKTYYVDFVCHELKLVIELDGSQHETIAAIKYDNQRTDNITSQGYRIIRIPNEYIYKELDSVVYHLKQIIGGDINANDYFPDKYKLGTSKNYFFLARSYCPTLLRGDYPR
ncbi:hypothetical protein AGMMS49525_07700 [Bacteroidia bacterium]|nr:hypothetical protein AGMMS49525_07700 [Bacteroidia bacterium]